ncbi:unnamed protein product [Callosobruchus maculatus]|uniref:Uncharacterized protein n=1 Tax=Callosobruchus maculatus TaxID=64391 RepID=A0A653DT87_CALMS|nr:unnamed protein product [Callosobruchus maculatus]
MMEALKHSELRSSSREVQRLKDWSSGWWLTASENLACIKKYMHTARARAGGKRSLHLDVMILHNTHTRTHETTRQVCKC